MMNGRSESYIEAAIEGEVDRLASAVPGERNQALFKSSAALAGLGLPEGRIIHHLKPVAEGIGLRSKELYATLKSGVRTGRANPRPLLPTRMIASQSKVIQPPVPAGVPSRSAPEEQGQRPTFVMGDDGPRVAVDEIRRHVYRRNGVPVRIKVKRGHGYVNWYRVSDQGRLGWQAGKPAGYLACLYVGAVDPFDPELAGDALFWPEGEKDCDTLGNLPLPAFTFGGVGDGLPAGCAEWTRNRHLIIFADNDAAGRAHAIKKAEVALGIAASIKIVGFPELAPGGDVSDYLASNTADDLQQLVEHAPFWTPPDGPAADQRSSDHALLTCNLADIAPEKVDWLWPGRVAIGKLTMIAGEPGLGKSQLCIAIAAAVTTGGQWPAATDRAPMGSVIVLSAEDGLADTIRPRFDAAGGNASKVCVIRAVQRGTAHRKSFDLAADLVLLEQEIMRVGRVRLVLIDPVSSYLGRIDSHKNADVRSLLEPLGEMAERLRVAIVAVTHLSKGDGKAINRFIGSIAFVAAARAAFAVVADPDDDAGLRRLLLQVKNNIAAPQPGLAFRLEQREVAPEVIGSAIAWDETIPVTITVDQALSERSARSEGTAKDDAAEFLRDILSAGPVDVLDIEAQARAAAMLSDSKRLKESKPFRSAAKELGIIRTRQGFGPGARMQWTLPDEGGVAGTAGSAP